MVNTCIKYLEKTLSKFPNKIAVDDGINTITFAELKTKAQAISGAISSGLKNSPIAIFLPKNLDCIVGFIGALYSENFYVPIDIKMPKTRVELILKTLQPLAMIVTKESKSFSEKVAPKLITID